MFAADIATANINTLPFIKGVSMELSIGVDGRTFSVPEPGGTVQVGQSLTSELLNSDANIEIFGHNSVKKTFPERVVNSWGYLSQSRLFGLFWEQIALPTSAKKAGIDVLYSPESYCPLSPVPFPRIITIHDLSSFHGYSSKLYNHFQQNVLPVMADAADGIVTVSEFSKRDISKHLDVNPEKIHVVHNGINQRFFSDEIPDVSLDLPDKYILYVGSISTRKNISGLIRGFTILKNRHRIPHKLVLVGPEDDPTNSQVNVTARGDTVERDIINLGYLSESELERAYYEADVFAFPSLFEGFGIPPLEAMACETPVVASDATAVPEVLGDAAHYVDPKRAEDIASGIATVLDNEEYRQELVVRGQERARLFTWERSSQDLLEYLVNSKNNWK